MEISVVVALSADATGVDAALKSILDQTHPPIEIIVVAEAALAEARHFVTFWSRDHPITLLTMPPGGLFAGFNLGVRHARGSLIALADHRARWFPSHLAVLEQPFQQERPRNLGWTYGDYDEVDLNGRLITQSVLTLQGQAHPKTQVVECLRQDMSIRPSTALIARSAFQAAGGYDEHLAAYQSDDLFVRILRSGYESVFVGTAVAHCQDDPNDTASYGSRNRGRMDYARKLLESFAHDRERQQLYARQIIAPRFAADTIKEARNALRTKDTVWIDRCMADLRFIDNFLPTVAGGALPSREPLISVIIPLYNGAAFIEESIRSVLGQSRSPDEIIVVDDGSTDNGAAIIERLALDHAIRLIRQENAGQSAARNIAVDHAHGDLIAFLDQDDVWYPNHLAELVEPFTDDRAVEVGWAYSDLDEIDEAGNLVMRSVLTHHAMPHPKRDLITCLKQDMFILPSATLVSRKAFHAVGGFDERLSGYEDDDLFLRMFRAGYDNVFLPMALSKWRIFHTSSSYSPRMALSRITYATMLIERFPNDPEFTFYYVRDLIAPRFFRLILGDLRRGIIKRNKAQQTQAVAHLAFIVAFLRWQWRLPFQLLLLPALRLPFFPRLLVFVRRPLGRLLMRFF